MQINNQGAEVRSEPKCGIRTELNSNPSCFSLKWRRKGRYLLHAHGTSCYSCQNQRWWMCSGSVPQSKPAETGSKNSVLELGVPYYCLGNTSNTLGRTTGCEVNLFPRQTFNHYPKSQLTCIREEWELGSWWLDHPPVESPGGALRCLDLLLCVSPLNKTTSIN